MIGTYLGQVIRFAFERSFRLTDQLSVFAALVVPSIIKLWGRSVVDTWGDYVAVGILTLVGTIIVLRLLNAPYFIWCEQNEKITKLQNALALPEQIERQRLATHLGEVRAEIASELAQLGQKATAWELRDSGRSVPLPINRAEELIHEISYDETLAGLCREYLNLCRSVAVKREARGNERDADAEKAALEAVGKQVFKLLHRAS